MSLTVGPAFTISGYTTVASPDHGTESAAAVYAADALVGYAAFWSSYLAGPLGADRESGESFEVTPAEFDAVGAVLNDPERWPVVSVRLDGDAWLRIVYRNFEEDEGLDFVEECPGRPPKVFTLDDGAGMLTWDALLAVADLPDERLTWAQRLILMLPMLEPQELPADAREVLDRALAGIGCANRAAVAAALLDSFDWHPRLDR